MNKTILTCLLSYLLTVACCTLEKKSFSAPLSDLGHIDLILDSAAYFSVMNDNFLTNEFAFFFKDTVTYGGKPSYDLYLGGQQNFLHISLAKGYWQDKSGSGVLTFQTRRPDQKDSLYLTWKQYYSDSLFSHMYNGPDFNLGEVMVYEKKDSSKPPDPVFFSNLTSYSSQSYKNWGFGDSDVINGISMSRFMANWDSSVKQKLFKKINALHVQITQDEFKDLSSALKTVGYTEGDGKFIHEFNPPVYYRIGKNNAVPKYTLIDVELSKPVTDTTYSIGTAYQVEIKGNQLKFISKQ
jgi:hypothetical protein